MNFRFHSSCRAITAPAGDVTLPRRRGLVQMLGHFIIQCGFTFIKFARDRQEYNRLLAMPDYRLADMGLSREDIKAARMRLPNFTGVW